MPTPPPNLGTPSENPFAHPPLPPTAATGPLIIGTNGTVSAIDTRYGRILWTTNLSSGFFSATRCADISVIVGNGIVIAGGSGNLFGLDPATGRILWHNSLPGLGFNDISMALEGVSIQYQQKTVKESSNSSN